jgi:hypothetical protein
MTPKKMNWFPLPDPVREDEVNLSLRWSADSRTTQTIERQTSLMGMTPTEYLRQALARGDRR